MLSVRSPPSGPDKAVLASSSSRVFVEASLVEKLLSLSSFPALSKRHNLKYNSAVQVCEYSQVPLNPLEQGFPCIPRGSWNGISLYFVLMFLWTGCRSQDWKTEAFYKKKHPRCGKGWGKFLVFISVQWWWFIQKSFSAAAFWKWHSY